MPDTLCASRGDVTFVTVGSSGQTSAAPSLLLPHLSLVHLGLRPWALSGAAFSVDSMPRAVAALPGRGACIMSACRRGAGRRVSLDHGRNKGGAAARSQLWAPGLWVLLCSLCFLAAFSVLTSHQYERLPCSLTHPGGAGWVRSSLLPPSGRPGLTAQGPRREGPVFVRLGETGEDGSTRGDGPVAGRRLLVRAAACS